jgi:hypothetical protein
MDDVPKAWVAAVHQINKAFNSGVDFTKINSYHNMKKITVMLDKAQGKVIETPKAEGPAVVEPVAEPVAEPEVEDVPILDEPVVEEPAPADGPAEELEPEPKKEDAPKIVANPDLENEDIVFAAAVVDAALKSGQVLDPNNIVLCPVDLLLIVKQLDGLTEGKRNAMVKSLGNLVKTAYNNHLAEAAKGAASVAQARARKEAKLAAQASANKQNPTMILPQKAAANDAPAPPKRTPKEESSEFANSFAALLSESQ